MIQFLVLGLVFKGFKGAGNLSLTCVFEVNFFEENPKIYLSKPFEGSFKDI